MLVMFELSKIVNQRGKGYERIDDSDLHVSVQQADSDSTATNPDTPPENADHGGETASQAAKRIALLVLKRLAHVLFRQRLTPF